MSDLNSSERRKQPRIPVVIPIRLSVPGAEERAAAKSFNLSAGGVGLFAEKTFEVGAELEVFLPVGETADMRKVKARVRWIRPNDSMGLELTDLDPETAEALEQLVLTLSEGSPEPY